MLNPIEPRAIDVLFAIPGVRRAVGELAPTTAIFVADARVPEAPIVFVNGPFTRTTGLLRDDVLGRSWTLLDTGGGAPTSSIGPIAPGSPRPVELPNLVGDGMPTSRFLVHAVQDGTSRVTAYLGVAAVSCPLNER